DSIGRWIFKRISNEELYALLKADGRQGDIFVQENRRNGLCSTMEPLYQHLRAHGKMAFLLAGVNMDQC
ncbi:hypothetical protein K469DRAFT_462417, partial [Zopfia rhizophila CBS 207.26]